MILSSFPTPSGKQGSSDPQDYAENLSVKSATSKAWSHGRRIITGAASWALCRILHNAHHLALAGRNDTLFADDAIARLHRASNGLPRALNNAAVAALIAAASDGKDLVDDTCAKKAAAELTRD